jgi:antirestriction protein ArdC
MPSQAEIRRDINERIIEGLKAGIVPWVRPWSNDLNCGLPKNISSKKPYRGINPLLLSLTADARSYSSRWWGTYRQWQALGGQVKRRPKDVALGEWGTTVVFYKQIEKKTDDEEQRQSYRLLRTFTVFNVEQVAGDFDHLQPTSDTIQPVVDDYRRAQRVIEATKADIRMSGNKCVYFRPVGDWPKHTDGDYILLPHRRQFMDQADYFSAAFHELSHWTEVRTKWNGSYALGELRAEISACYLASACNVPNSRDLENHNRYLASWLKELKDDHTAIFRAAAAASKASDFILSFSKQSETVAV